MRNGEVTRRRLSAGGAMTTLTLRAQRGHFTVTGPDIEPLKFKSRREAKDWCAEQPGSPIKEIGADAATKTGRRNDRSQAPTDWALALRSIIDRTYIVITRSVTVSSVIYRMSRFLKSQLKLYHR